MKISYNWLKEYIQFEENAEELAIILTDLGLEVSSIEPFCSIAGGLEGLVIGEVINCEKHPGADKLSITKVDVGTTTLLPIVCGAPNVAAGQKVVVATVGTTLYPTQGESFTIKKAKIRGEVSEGMICAEDEIGIGISHDGILVLPNEIKNGTPASKYFNIEHDTTIEVDLTPNRIDAASHIGVARDLAAYFNMQKPTTITIPSIDSFDIDNTELPIAVEVTNNEACPRYMGITVSNIEIKQSPAWLANRIKAIGLHPINNIVDITNFVLFETGQPLHAFDADKIIGGKIIVRTLSDNTPFTTLDNEERKLSKNDLMICNAEAPMCMAGVFGGLYSGVTNETTNIFIESAYFNPGTVRKTARLHGLNTDSSFRFERGADINMTEYALKRAALLIKQIAGGNISSNIVDVYPNNFKPIHIPVKISNIYRLIGKQIELSLIKNILNALEISLKDENPESFTAIVPCYRVDVTREADIIEEILRVYGYNRIEEPAQLRSSLSYSTHPTNETLIENATSLLTSNGFSEIMCNSISRNSYYLGTQLEPIVVNLHNPLSNDLNCMRADIIFGGLESISRNVKRQQYNVRIFEIGKVYSKISAEAAINISKNFEENIRLGIWISGDMDAIHWNNREKPSNFYQIKGYLEMILNRFNIGTSAYSIDEASDYRFEFGLTYSLNSTPLVIVGKVSDMLLKITDVAQDVFFADINWSALSDIARKHKTSFHELAKFPKVRRDLALLLDKGIDYKQVKELALNTERKYLKQIDLFDVYEGENLPKDKKSYAVLFILQDTEKTMTDKQIERIMNRLISTFQSELGAEIR
jgi:phenylalanyl-tRNA synthetase beta chain